MLNPISKQSFDQLVKQGYNRIPLVTETFADLDTPLSLYLKLANKPYSYLLESVQGGERFGRYSFIGLPADIRITVRGKKITINNLTGETRINADNPLRLHQGLPFTLQGCAALWPAALYWRAGRLFRI